MQAHADNLQMVSEPAKAEVSTKAESLKAQAQSLEARAEAQSLQVRREEAGRGAHPRPATNQSLARADSPCHPPTRGGKYLPAAGTLL